MDKRKNNGGARAGAGRKPKPKGVRFQVTISPGIVEKLGAKEIRRRLRKSVS